jgi:hypothetical protein
MALDTSFNRMVAVTLPKYAPRITSSIIGSIALLWKMGLNGAVETREGGSQIVEPVALSKNSTVKGYFQNQTLDTILQNEPNAASYLWKIIAGTDGLSFLEMGQNSGSSTRVLDLWDAILMRLSESMRDETNRQLFLDGTGDGGADLIGLQAALDFIGTNSVYGNIDSAVFTNWRNQTEPSPADVETTPANLPPVMNAIKNDCTSGNEMPDLYITTKRIHQIWEGTLTPNQRYIRDVADDDMLKAGFTNYIFGGAPMCFDDQMFPNTDAAGSATAGNGFLALNTRHLRFVMMEGYDFMMTDPVEPFDKMQSTVKSILHANLVVKNRRRQGRVNISTA